MKCFTLNIAKPLPEKSLAFWQNWHDALISGRYTQDTLSHKLRSDYGYCCLGVLCDLEDPDYLDENPCYCQHVLENLSYFNVIRNYKSIDAYTGPISFAVLNDEDRLSFKQIAKIIKDLIIYKKSECIID